MVEDRIYEHKGKDGILRPVEIVEGSGVAYMELKCEQYLKQALATSTHGLRRLKEPVVEFDKKGNPIKIERLCDRDNLGTYCTYTRLRSPKIKPDAFFLEYWNDYPKIIESVDFINLQNKVRLQKYTFFIAFHYVGDIKKAEEALKDGFYSFRDMVQKIRPGLKEREPIITEDKDSPFKTKPLILEFGSKDEKIPIELEFLLQREILHLFFNTQKNAPKQSP